MISVDNPLRFLTVESPDDDCSAGFALLLPPPLIMESKRSSEEGRDFVFFFSISKSLSESLPLLFLFDVGLFR